MKLGKGFGKHTLVRQLGPRGLQTKEELYFQTPKTKKDEAKPGPNAKKKTDKIAITRTAKCQPHLAARREKKKT